MMSDGVMTLRGRIGSDLLSYKTKNGHSCVRFRLAVSRWRVTDSGGFAETGTQWYTVKAWGRLGQNAQQSFLKGQKIIVVGKAHAEAWQSKDGNIQSALSITAHTLGHDISRGITQYSPNPNSVSEASSVSMTSTMRIEECESSSVGVPSEGIDNFLDRATDLIEDPQLHSSAGYRPGDLEAEDSAAPF